MTIPKISLVLSDIDGTLLDPTKQITPAAKAAVAALREKDIRFAVASSRPARGLKYVAETLGLDTPMSGFNGARVLTSDWSVVQSMALPDGVAAKIVVLLTHLGLSSWVYAGDDWYISDAKGYRVDRETHSVAFDPIVVARFSEDVLSATIKIVGVSENPALVAAAEREVNAQFGDVISATRSQPVYLDITHAGANKGEAVKMLARHYKIPTAEIVTIGDAANDVLMFRESGYSFAMGNATDAVKAEAKDVTDTNANDGFAKAMMRVVEAQ